MDVSALGNSANDLLMGKQELHNSFCYCNFSQEYLGNKSTLNFTEREGTTLVFGNILYMHFNFIVLKKYIIKLTYESTIGAHVFEKNYSLLY